jgi:cell division protease FtsH
MSNNKNRLSFNLYSDAETKLVNVVCVEGIGCLAAFTPAYEKFEKAHSTTAHSLDKILSALNDVFIAGDVEKDLELVRVSMAMLETHPFMFYLEYLEDTVSPKLSHTKPNKPEVIDMHKLFQQMPMMGMKGDVPGMMFNQPDLDMFLGSRKPSREEKKEETKRTSLTFDDVVGMHEVKDKLRDVIDQFKNAEKYKAWNIKPIKGILLYGPSGTGKSYISEAFANEIDAKFFPLSSADIISKYLGESGKSIRAKFEEARKHPLSIIYIDEVDSIAAKRDGSENNKERNATLNELLVQMASPENDNVIMIFATNMLDLLDPAFLRSGRCDFKIEVSLPDFDCRKGILEINSKGRPLAEDVDFDKISRNMSGMNCADMAVVANEAARKALKAGKDVIEAEDFDKAFEEMICGAKSETKRLGEKEKDTVAIHETGHLLANELFKVNKTKKISILPRGTTLGFVMHANEEEDDKFLQSKSELMNRIKVCLAGRAAEEVFFGDVTTGAANDLEKANGIVEAMICNYALIDELGLSTFDMKNPMVIGLIQEYKNKILDQCYNEVITMIVSHKEQIRDFANVLKEKEEMTGDEINEILYPETAEAE